MSAGCVPVVFHGGGQKEIVEDEKNGFVWNSLNDLFHKTQLLTTNRWKLEELSSNAKERAQNFSIEAFTKSIHELIS